MVNQKVIMVPMKNLAADPDQPRQEFDPKDLLSLEQSIKKQGVLVPLAVEKRGGKYVIVDGERRYRASTMVGLKELPVIVYDTMDSQTRLVTRFHLQEQHSLWSPVDKARVLSQMMNDTGMTPSEIANLVGMRQSTVAGYLALLELNTKTVAIANEAKIPHTYLRNIAAVTRRIENPSQRQKLQEALVLKVKIGVILRAADIGKYGVALTKNQPLVEKAILENAELTPNQALELAKAKAELSLKTITVNAGWLKSSLTRGMEEGANRLLTEVDEKTLNSLVETIQQFVTGGGFVMPSPKAEKQKVVRN